jgi:DNA-binding SARP family transcriptional activator/tetratricopeptide (TPR) repeat protein
MLRVSLLGEQAITDGVTGFVRTRSPRLIALVALLVTHAGVPQSRQRIAGLFWPDSTDAQALTNLRRELHHLRHVLGDEPSLVVTTKDLCWRDSGRSRVDVRIFDVERKAALAAVAAGDGDAVLTHATAALAQYRGALLPGVHDDWLLEAREELEDHCVHLCDLLGETRARRGDLAGALQVTRRRIQMRPLEEGGYRTLMDLYADLGDRASAVSTYHQCASILERELGVLPDEATRNALQRLLVRPSSAKVPLREIKPGRSGFAAAELVGRSHEVDLLRKLWQVTMAGRTGLALVRGDAGVGKTRLVAEIAEIARRQGAVVASTLCFGTSERLPLAPVADWLRNPAIQLATRRLDPVWRTEVDRLVPADKGRGEPVSHSRAMADAWQRHRFFEGLGRALTGIGRPTLLVLDNMQWCDQETLMFLTFCLHLLPDAPLLVVGTLRTEHAKRETHWAEWAAQMRATGLLMELSLNPLEATDTARLAEAISGLPLGEHDLALLQATTGGFPLYIVEAVRGSADLGTASPLAGDLMAVLRNRLEQPGPNAREIAGLAAALGRNFTLDLLTEASDLDQDTVVQAVDELWRHRIIYEFHNGYDFSHDLLRETAYELVSPPKRWLLHRRLAQSLELLHGNDTDAVSAQLAEQYARGGRPERAVAFYRRAAEVAAGTFAHAEAIRLLKKALTIVRGQLEGKASAQQELAVLEAMAGPLNARYGYSSPELQQALEHTIELAERLGRKDSTLTGLVGLWTSRFVQGRTTHAHEAAVRALALAESGSTDEQHGSAHFAVAGSSVSLGRPAVALRHFEVAAELTRSASSWPIGTRPDVHGSAWAAHAHWLLGHDDEAVACCHDAVELARSISHLYSLAVALAYAGITHQMRHDLPALKDAVGELGELCDRYGFAYYREWALVLGGWAGGDVPGIDLAQRGIDNLKAEGSFARMPYWLSLLADLAARNDRPAAARATLDAALVTGQARDDLWWLPEVMRMRAAYDDPAAAVTRLCATARLAHTQGSAALLRRCEHDLAERGVRFVPPAS